ncbi:MAG: AcrR family transcriptional regulator [Lentimonas sp.]
MASRSTGSNACVTRSTQSWSFLHFFETKDSNARLNRVIELVMATVTQNTTRTRLLEAAMALFAEGGFEQTTVASISTQAEANVAAVNYHFGDKQSLYREALRAAYDQANQTYPVALRADANITPEQRLRHHIYAMIAQIFCPTQAGYLCRMVAKEFAEPTFAVDMIFSELIRQNRAHMWIAISGILGANVSEQRIHLAMMSVVAQFQFYNFSRLIREIGRTAIVSLPESDAIAEHIYQFSLAGLRGMLECPTEV